MLALLRSGDEALVNAFRDFQFHRDEALFVQELIDLKRSHVRAP